MGFFGDVWDTLSGKSSWNASAPMLDRGGAQGIDAAARAQQGFSGELGRAAMGGGPTAAGGMFTQQSEMAQAQARGMSAGNTSGNMGLALRAGADAGARARGMAANDAAMLRAREQQAAQQLHAQNLAQQRQQAFQESAANQSSTLTNQGYAAQTAAGNAAGAQKAFGSIAGAVGSALLSDERAKTDIQPTSGGFLDGLRSRLGAAAGRVVEGTRGAFENETGMPVEDYNVQAQHAAAARKWQQEQQESAIWAELQRIADADAAKRAAAEAARTKQSGSPASTTMMSVDVPDAPSRREANRAYRDTGVKKPKKEEEKGMSFGEILEKAGAAMGAGGGGASIQASPYSSGGGGGQSFFSGGGGYNPLQTSDVRSKTDVIPSTGAMMAPSEGLRAGTPPPGASSVGDFSKARQGSGQSVEQQMRELEMLLAQEEQRKRAAMELSQRAGEQQALDALRQPAQYPSLGPAPTPAPAYGKFPQADWRGGP